METKSNSSMPASVHEPTDPADRAIKISREIANLNHAYSFHRQIAAVVLGQIGDVTAVPALIHALSDSTADVRMAAAVALGQIGDVTSVPALICALADNRHWVRRCVRETLRNMGNADTLPCQVLSAAHISVKNRIAILAAMGRAGSITGSRLQYDVLPLSDYCQSLLKRDDITADVKTEARAVLAYQELVRHSAPGAATEHGELLRVASATECASLPAEMVRVADTPQASAPKPVARKSRVRIAWDRLRNTPLR